MRPYSSPFLSFLAYGGSLRSVSSHRTWGPPQISFFTFIMKASIRMPFFYTIWRPLGSFLCILYWGPPITFFAYYMGPLRSVSSHTIWWPISDQFHCLLYGPPPPPPPQISFFACYRWATSDFSLFTKYMGPPSDQFLRLLYGGPLRSVSSHTL